MHYYRVSGTIRRCVREGSAGQNRTSGGLTMKWRCNVIAVGSCVAVLVFHARPASATASCERLASLSFPDTKITMAQPVAAGAFTPPAGRGRGAAAPVEPAGAPNDGIVLAARAA